MTESGSATRNRKRVPLHERRRVLQACENCRKRKLRCPGSQPCNRCKASGSECNYPPSEGSRANPSIAHVSELKNRQAFMEYIINCVAPDLSLDTKNLRRVCAEMKASPNPKEVLFSGNILVESSASSAGPSLPRPSTAASVTQSSDIEEVNDVLSGRGRLMPERQGYTHYLGESAGWSFLDSVRETLTTDENLMDVAKEYSHVIGAPSLYNSRSRENSLRHLLPPSEIASEIVDAFVKYSQFQLFACHEEVFYGQIARLYSTIDSELEDTPFLGVFLVILAIGTQFAELENFGYINYLRSTGNYDRRHSESDAVHHGIEFYQGAASLLPQIIASCTITSVQYCLLMCCYLQRGNARDASYAYLGMALRMAVSNGLHRNSDALSTDTRIIELRKRLWWTIFSLDRFTGIAMGRPTTIRDADCDVGLPTYVSGLDSPRYAGALELFNADIRMGRIFGHIMTQLYTIPKNKESSTSICRRDIMTLLEEISEWKRSLPNWMEREANQSSSPCFRRAVCVFLAYCLGIIMATRPFLLHLVRSRKRSASKPTPQEIHNQTLIEQLSHSCGEAAFKQIELILRLQASGKLSRFEFWDYHYCCAGVYVLILSCILKWDDTFARYAKLGMGTMQYIAEVSPSAKVSHALMAELLDLLESKGDHTQSPKSQNLSKDALGSPLPVSHERTPPSCIESFLSNSSAFPANSDTVPGLPRDNATDAANGADILRLQSSANAEIPSLLDSDTSSLLNEWPGSENSFSLYGIQDMTLSEIVGFPMDDPAFAWNQDPFHVSTS